MRPTSTESEFELQVGVALDTLRRDYPQILTQPPDFSIYDKHIEVVDPSGVKVHGLSAYKYTFRLLHTLVKFIYCPSRSGLTFRMCFDKARQSIRIHWNAEVVPREIFGGSRTTLFVDGISVYEMDRVTGSITQHRIEQLLINNNPVRPAEGVFAALRNEHTVTVPSFSKSEDRSVVVRYQQPLFPGPRGPSSLFAMEASRDDDEDKNNDTNGGNQQYPNLDWEALERKNKSRKKFGLDPLSPEEFLEVEAQVKQMDLQQKQRAATDAAAAAAGTSQKRKSGGFFDKLLGGAAAALQDTCETNFDCERPEICCDFGFKKVCCSSGSLVGLQQQQQRQALAPVPVVAGYPPDVRNL